MKKAIFFILIPLFLIHSNLSALTNEGQIVNSFQDTNNLANNPTLGLAYNNTVYWVTSSNIAMPGSSFLYSVDPGYSLTSVNPSTLPYYIGLTYDYDAHFFIACEHTNIVRLDGTVASNSSPSSTDYFTPPGGISDAIEYIGNDKILVANNSQIYVVALSPSYSSHTASIISNFAPPLSFTASGIAYDGRFLWILDTVGILLKYDMNNNILLTNYDLSLSITMRRGDITFDKDKGYIIVYGSDGVANFYEINAAPLPVTNVSAVDKGTGNTVTVSWDPSSEPSVSDYVVRWDTSPTGTFSNSITTFSTTVDITGLSNFATYYFMVSARDSDLTEIPIPQQKMLFNIVSATPTKPATTLIVNQTSGPYFNITSAISAAGTGDIIKITDNKFYNENIVINKNYITLKGESGYLPVLDITTPNTNVITVFGTNVTINNLKIFLEVAATSTKGILVNGKQNVVQNCLIEGNDTGTQIGIYDNTGTFSSNFIKANKISGVYEGIYIGNNTVGEFVGKNSISNCNYGIVSDNAGAIIYQNNIFNISTDGIEILGPTDDYNMIGYNVIYNTTSGISLLSLGNGIDKDIYNNTLVKNDFGIYFGSVASNFNANVSNNIIYYNNTKDIIYDTGAISITANLGYNCYANFSNNGLMPTINEIQYISDEPSFVNLNSNDFHLAKNSPCIDAGKDLSFYNDLKDIGINMPVIQYNARDIGAYEYIAGVEIPPTRKDREPFIRLTSNYFKSGETTTAYIVDMDKLAPEDSETIFIRAKIFDLRGKIVKRLYNGTAPVGSYFGLNWDGKDDNGNYVGAGLYILKVDINGISATEKIFFIP